MVIRVQVNVFGREVAGPEGDGGIALLQAKVDVRVSVFANRCRDGFRIEGDRVTCFIEHRAIELEADFAGVKVGLRNWPGSTTGRRGRERSNSGFRRRAPV